MSGVTIFALSSAAGRAGVAVVRISGPAAGESLRGLTGGPLPRPRQAVLTVVSDPLEKVPLDRGLVLWFPAPQSFTGEDVAEVHLHGGRAIVDRVLGCLGRMAGLRPAEPGEFTRRAFDHGKMDLAEVEGLADLIAAETEAQRRLAYAHFGGHFSRQIETWRDRVVRALAHHEALIDFADEELPAETAGALESDILYVKEEISQYLVDGRRGERLRDGLQVVIVGPPNVGKSSLLNRIAARDAAIVSAVAGTTRDLIEVHLDLGGYPVTLVDGAGLRALPASERDTAAGSIEAEGMRRARARAAAADLKVVVFDGRRWPDLDPVSLDLLDADSLVVFNKEDIRQGPPLPETVAKRPAMAVSARTGEGVGGLLDALESAVAARLGERAGVPALTRTRHRVALETCRDGLARALETGEAELIAEDLRLAVRALGRITGRVDVEDLLDVIFRDFCIGK